VSRWRGQIRDSRFLHNACLLSHIASFSEDPYFNLHHELVSKALVTNRNRIYHLAISYILYGCETWSLTVREEHKLRVFENRMLRRIFGPKKDGVTGGWR
jgi:hypothetical protein